jgi:hypothetical protein
MPSFRTSSLRLRAGATEFAFAIVTEMSDGTQATRTAVLAVQGRYEIYSDQLGVWEIRDAGPR